MMVEHWDEAMKEHMPNEQQRAQAKVGAELTLDLASFHVEVSQRSENKTEEWTQWVRHNGYLMHRISAESRKAGQMQ